MWKLLLSNDNEFGKSFIIFGATRSSSVHIDNKKKDILILSKDPTYGLDQTTSSAKKEYSIIFTEQNKSFV